jgi:hypothetical protein
MKKTAARGAVVCFLVFSWSCASYKWERVKLDPVKNASNKKSESGEISRFHLAIETGYFTAQSSSDMTEYMRESGFGDTEYYMSGGWTEPWFQSAREYPSEITRKNYLPIKNIKASFSLNRTIDVGFSYSNLGKWSIVGFRSLETATDIFGFLASLGPYLSWELSGHAYFLSAAWKFLQSISHKGYYLDLGIGLGLSKFDSDFYSETLVHTSSQISPALMTFLEGNIFILRNLSLGLHAEYKYVPFTMESYGLELPWQKGTVNADFPSKKVDLSGFGYGINVGFHF